MYFSPGMLCKPISGRYRMVTDDQLKKCIEIASKFGVTKLVLFGSCLDSLANARDIDLICEGMKNEDYFKMGAEMESAAGITVDVVPLEPKTPFVEYNLRKGRVLYAV
jgi:predicted nucleotidyltransferase